MELLSPEMALIKVLDSLKKYVLINEDYEEIVPAGSVPLGTYVGIPDLDIFILVDGRTNSVMRALGRYYHDGHRKTPVKDKGLSIWHVQNLHGYDVDFVVMDKADEKVQTLRHVKYYQEVLTDEMRGRIYWLKKFFKEINCYGAEVGGITGICITRLAELDDDIEVALHFLITNLLLSRVFVEDPTLKGRNLFASVIGPKVVNMIDEINNYLTDGIYNDRDLDYFFDNYPRVYKIKRKKNVGTDKEFQLVYSAIRKTWKQLKQRIRWWGPRLEYDILVTPWDIYIGFRVTPEEITEPAVEKIPLCRLNQKSINELASRGAIYTVLTDTLDYPRKPPFRYVVRLFETQLQETLSGKGYYMERV